MAPRFHCRLCGYNSTFPHSKPCHCDQDRDRRARGDPALAAINPTPVGGQPPHASAPPRIPAPPLHPDETVARRHRACGELLKQTRSTLYCIDCEFEISKHSQTFSARQTQEMEIFFGSKTDWSRNEYERGLCIRCYSAPHAHVATEYCHACELWDIEKQARNQAVTTFCRLHYMPILAAIPDAPPR